MRVRKIVDILENEFNQNIFEAVRLSEANSAYWDDVHTLGLRIATTQQVFKKMRLKDPKQAQKMAIACEVSEKQLLSDVTKTNPTIKKCPR